MGKKILDSKALYVFLSIVIAIALWFYITTLDGNERTEPINNIPITFVGVESLEARGLMIVGDTPTASIQVKAAPAVLTKLMNNPPKLTVNVSKIEAAAEYRMAYTVTLPSGVSSDQVEFVSGGTGNVSFTVARYITRDVEVRGVFVGTVEEGYLPGASDEFIFSPAKLTISGQADLVNQVAYALVTIDGEDLTESVSGEYTYQLIGASGDVLEDLDVECDSDTIYTSYPVLATAEIQLDVKLVTGGGVSQDNVNYTLSTNSITVAGDKDAVAAVAGSTHIVAAIDLGTVNDGDELVYTIPLTDELQNISGITEVTVTISFKEKRETRTVETTQIECIGVPEGWKADVITKVLAVKIRGSAELMEAVTPESIRVIVDVENISLTPGQHTVQAKVYLDSAGTVNEIGVLGTDYKVVILLSEG